MGKSSRNNNEKQRKKEKTKKVEINYNTKFISLDFSKRQGLSTEIIFIFLY